VFVNDTFFQGNNSIICDRYVFGADFSAALGYVAIADAKKIFQVLGPVLGIEGMHLERGRVNEKSRADELIVLFVIAKHMTNVLA
jgi:hypothetical protein